MIRVREVSVIGDDGESIGTIPTEEALSMAEEQNMDLVEVSPNSNPPVCRIMDYGKHKYKASKKAHEAKKKQKIIHVKEVKFRPNTDQHDFDFKLRNVLRFLENGDKAKVVIFFKGREIVHREFGMKVLERVAEATEETAVIEQQAKQEGRTLVMILAPKNTKTKKGGTLKAQPVSKPAEVPTEKPAEVPAATPVEVSVEKPAEE
ncbi:MAG: translation initiation factor IF-3 [Nitrospina sp.]|jgi:translation initiation factor IF-3|nr:translation initiation factor IF-3 [Nitrospina sp.]MBT3508524.1 translation initiation factor IF-3 [Nitrospina sp.]MBT3875300.1 translation initiation factor IF-3 [Nitrospina sp.]MBT4048615.1 translation initiation factor IF-3 [Nitrospina sp.]MBT4559043.1 translation initiation factor IF-3 [Nitrospina sp.]